MKKFYLLATLFFLFCTQLSAQDIHNHRTCGTMEYMERQLKEHPEYAQRRAAIEEHRKSHTASGLKTNSLIIIPVVVHNVYKNATDSINMNDVLSQIDSLNKDFRLQNADKSKIPAPFLPVAADFEIQFCLANKDPQGNPTTGLTHTLTTKPSFSTNDDIKFNATGGKDGWPSSDYLNIWVGELGGGLLGYATFPGGPANEDGVVIGANCFGSQNPGLLSAYDLGRTAPHEIGHWLNLRHVWADDGGGCSADDLVNDTPVADNANYGCQTYPFLTTCQPAAPGEMFMNYMDYGDDDCIIMFTLGQKQRGRVLFDPGGARESLLNSAVTHCAAIVPPPPVFFVNAGVMSIPSPIDTICSNNITPSFVLTNLGNLSLTSATIEYTIDGGSPIAYNWSGTLDSLQTALVNLPSSSVTIGNHIITITVTSANGAADPIPSNDSQTQNFFIQAVAGQPMPYFEGFEAAVFPSNGINILNPDAGITWDSTSSAWFLGTHSCRIKNVNNNTIGAIDELQLPSLDWTNLSYPKLEFDLAYANYTAGASDTLEILISTDCGANFQRIAKLFGASLTTTHATTSAFVPTFEEWKHKVYNLAQYTTSGGSVAKIIFRNISGYENNMYLDNINVLATPTAITDNYNLGQLISFYPNPASDKIHLEYIAADNEDLTVEMIDMTGRSVQKWSQQAMSGKNEWEINFETQATGVYILRFSNHKATYTEKLSIK